MRSDEEFTFVERARRGQILDAAIGLLAEAGFGSASLSAIAGRIGVSKGVISYHFEGKDELLAQVVTRVLSEAGAAMNARMSGVEGSRDLLRAYVTANVEFLSTHRREVRALTAVLASSPPGPDGSPPYAAAGRTAVEALAALLQAGQDDGVFRPADAYLVARSLRASIDAVTEMLRTEPEVDVDGYAEGLLDLFEAAVVA